MADTFDLSSTSGEGIGSPSPFRRLLKNLKDACPKWDPSDALIEAWHARLGKIAMDEARAIFQRWTETQGTSVPWLKHVLEAMEHVRRQSEDDPAVQTRKAQHARCLQEIMSKKPKIEKFGNTYDPYATDADVAEAWRLVDQGYDPSPEPQEGEVDAREVGDWAGGVVDNLVNRFRP